METELFIKIVGSILTILAALITSYVIPAIKAKMTAEDMSTLAYYIQVAVRCADQIYTVEEWREKREYVKNYICGIVYDHLHIKITPEQIDTLIEGVVNEIHNNGTRSGKEE